MKNPENYQSFTAAELLEMMEEAKRAQRIIKSNDDLEIQAETKFYLGDVEILTVHSDSNKDFLALELTEMIKMLEEELTKR